MSRFLEAAVLDESLRIVSLWLLPKGVAEVHLMVVDEDHCVGRHLVSWINITSVSLTLSHRRPLTRYGGVPVGHVGHDGGAGVAHRLVEGGLNENIVSLIFTACNELFEYFEFFESREHISAVLSTQYL